MSDPVLTSLLRINRRRMVALRRVLTPHGYVGFMHLILTYTARHPGASTARDARRLEDAGHIRREIDPANRRQYQLFLTPQGEEMVEIIDQTHEEFQRRLSAGIAPEDWEKLTELLGIAEENSHRE